MSYERLRLGCILANNPSNTSTLVINATTKKNDAHVGGIVGSDEVWFNKGERRYYTGSRHAPQARAVLPPNLSKM